VSASPQQRRKLGKQFRTVVLNVCLAFQIFFYEWEILLKWKGHVNGNDKEVSGKIEICNLSEEHENMEDVDLVRIFKFWRRHKMAMTLSIMT
jgi:hypothetical protein